MATLEGTLSETLVPAGERAAPPRAKLQLLNVHKAFRSGGRLIHVLQNVSFDVRDGEFLCIVGPSGCGKTTLLNIMAGLESSDEGRVVLESRDVMGPSPDRVLIFQDAALFPWLTVRGNVEFGLRMLNVERRRRYEIVRELLRMVGLLSFENSFIHELSGGMRQRVALARGLALNPSVLLMDEPFASLDAQTRSRLQDDLERIWIATRKTIVFVTHNVGEAVRLADRVIAMTYRPGRVKAEFLVPLPRPRPREHAGMSEMSKILVEQLRDEVDHHLGGEPENAFACAERCI